MADQANAGSVDLRPGFEKLYTGQNITGEIKVVAVAKLPVDSPTPIINPQYCNPSSGEIVCQNEEGFVAHQLFIAILGT